MRPYNINVVNTLHAPVKWWPSGTGPAVRHADMTPATLAIPDDLLDDLNALIWEADPVTFQFSYVSRGDRKSVV